MLSIAHIINVTEITEAKKSSYLHVAQPVTMQSMADAKESTSDDIEVELWCVTNVGEEVDVHPAFNKAPSIDGYAHDHISALQEVEKKKPLPRLADIIEALYATSNAEYFVYTNVDIGLFPDFYNDIARRIKSGLTSFCINRRTVEKEFNGDVIGTDNYQRVFDMPSERHPGIDCFVFKRSVVPQLDLGNVFVGFPPIGQVLKTQIEKHSRNFDWLKDEHLTFHLGADAVWLGSESPYAIANMKEAEGRFIYCYDSPPVKRTLRQRLKKSAARLRRRIGL